MTKRIWCTLSVLAVSAVSLLAQSKTGTTVGQFLLIEPSARVAAMGNAGATLYGEVQAAYYNPAAIGELKSSGAQFTHSMWLADIAYDYVGAALLLGEFGTLYLSGTSLNSGEIDVRTVEQPLGTGERYTVSDLAFGLGYGRKVSDRFSVGVQIFYLQETIWHSALSAFSLNVGTLYQVAPNGLRIGASISNFGTRAKYDGRDLRILFDQNGKKFGDNSSLPAELFTNDYPLPILFRVGLGLPIAIDENHAFELAVDAFHPSDNTESVSIGGEYLLFRTLALRGGYQNIFLRDSEVGLTLGAGVRYETDSFNFYLDYSWANQGRLDKTQRLTVGVTF